jgi:hypothetical protein
MESIHHADTLKSRRFQEELAIRFCGLFQKCTFSFISVGMFYIMMPAMGVPPVT